MINEVLKSHSSKLNGYQIPQILEYIWIGNLIRESLSPRRENNFDWGFPSYDVMMLQQERSLRIVIKNLYEIANIDEMVNEINNLGHRYCYHKK